MDAGRVWSSSRIADTQSGRFQVCATRRRIPKTLTPTRTITASTRCGMALCTNQLRLAVSPFIFRLSVKNKKTNHEKENQKTARRPFGATHENNQSTAGEHW